MIHDLSAVHKKYRGFIFNADNTIFDFERAEKEALYETIKSLNILVSFEKIHSNFKKINKFLWNKILKNKITMSAFKVERFRLLLNKIDFHCNPYELSEFFLNCLSNKAYLVPNAVKTLEVLSKRSMLCLITNGFSYVQKSRIARSNIEVFFNEILISEETGITKPNPDIFKIASEKLYLKPYNILCTGSSPQTDILGGYYAGMDTCWFSTDLSAYPVNQPKPTIMISNLLELIPLASEVS